MTRRRFPAVLMLVVILVVDPGRRGGQRGRRRHHDEPRLSAWADPMTLSTAAHENRLAWIAYPKAGQLGTDLDRDVLAALAQERGIQPVRQVSIDQVWSALRFRPFGG